MSDSANPRREFDGGRSPLRPASGRDYGEQADMQQRLTRGQQLKEESSLIVPIPRQIAYTSGPGLEVLFWGFTLLGAGDAVTACVGGCAQAPG